MGLFNNLLACYKNFSLQCTPDFNVSSQTLNQRQRGEEAATMAAKLTAFTNP